MLCSCSAVQRRPPITGLSLYAPGPGASVFSAMPCRLLVPNRTRGGLGTVLSTCLEIVSCRGRTQPSIGRMLSCCQVTPYLSGCWAPPVLLANPLSVLLTGTA